MIILCEGLFAVCVAERSSGSFVVCMHRTELRVLELLFLVQQDLALLQYKDSMCRLFVVKRELHLWGQRCVARSRRSTVLYENLAATVRVLSAAIPIGINAERSFFSKVKKHKCCF